MTARKLLYVFTRAPYSNSMGQEALDAALIGAAFEQDISLLFMHDGVFQIRAGQSNENSLLKPYTKAFSALPDFGIDNIYVHDLSLRARALDSKQLVIEPAIIDSEAVRILIAQQFRVFTF